MGFTRCPCSSEALCRALLRYLTDTAQADGAGACRRRHCRRRRRAGVQGRSLLLSQRRARHPPLQAGHQAAMARPTSLGVFCALAALVAVGGRAEPPRCRYLERIPRWLQSQVHLTECTLAGPLTYCSWARQPPRWESPPRGQLTTCPPPQTCRGEHRPVHQPSSTGTSANTGIWQLAPLLRPNNSLAYRAAGG